MAKKLTRQARLITALETIGYARAAGRSTKYVEMWLGPNGRSLLKRTVAALMDGKLAPVVAAEEITS